MQQSGLVSILFPLFLFSCFSGKRGPIRKGNRQFRGGISWFSSLILGVTVIYSRTFQQGKLHVHHIHHHHCHHGIISHPRLSLVAQQRNPSLLLPAHRPFWVMVESGDFTLSLAVLWIHPRQNSVLVDHGYYPLQKGRFESNSLSTKSKNQQKSIWSCLLFFLVSGWRIKHLEKNICTPCSLLREFGSHLELRFQACPSFHSHQDNRSDNLQGSRHSHRSC